MPDFFEAEFLGIVFLFVAHVYIITFYLDKCGKIIVKLIKKEKDMKGDKKQNEKELLDLEIVVGLISFAMFFAVVLVAAFADMQDFVRILLIIMAVAFILAISFAMLKIEQIVGYYECEKCHHKYVPKYVSVLLAMHYGRTRYMTCPKCHKKSWQKKVL